MNQKKRKNRILLGKIATAHGVKGLVKLIVFADDPHALDEYGPVYTEESGGDALTLTLKNPMGKYWLAEVEGITGRDHAEKLRGTELWLDRTSLPEPAEGEYYHADLIGLRVENENGSNIGKIINVVNFGAGDLLEIKPPKTQSFYVTFTKENILQVILAEGKIIAAIKDEHLENT